MVEQMSEKPQCKYHWIIETPKGESSKGRCKNCGDEKMFRNYAWYSSGDGYNAKSDTRDFGSLSDSSSRISGPRLNRPIPGTLI